MNAIAIERSPVHADRWALRVTSRRYLALSDRERDRGISFLAWYLYGIRSTDLRGDAYRMFCIAARALYTLLSARELGMTSFSFEDAIYAVLEEHCDLEEGVRLVNTLHYDSVYTLFVQLE